MTAASVSRSRRKPKRAKQLGVTDAEYAAMLEQQGGGCAICGARPKTRRLHVDHDHRDPQHRVRGLLCHRCNRELPNWVTADWLRKAAYYLEPVELEPFDPAEAMRQIEAYAAKMPTHPNDVASKWREAVEAKAKDWPA